MKVCSFASLHLHIFKGNVLTESTIRSIFFQFSYLQNVRIIKAKTCSMGFQQSHPPPFKLSPAFLIEEIEAFFIIKDTSRCHLGKELIDEQIKIRQRWFSKTPPHISQWKTYQNRRNDEQEGFKALGSINDKKIITIIIIIVSVSESIGDLCVSSFGLCKGGWILFQLCSVLSPALQR